ncbi:MAG TPA: ABC transporter permease subunit [Balneolales bacterium]|nr:ABC transporter permease subunit [Balneolales bacterium]
MRNNSKWVLKSGMVIVYLFPFLYLAILSLTSRYPFPEIIPKHLDFSHWISVFTGESELTQSLLVSLTISLSVAAISTGLGFVTSRAFAKNNSERRLIKMTYLPFLFPPVIYASMLSHFFIIAHISGTVIGVIIGQVLIAYPFAILLLRGFWSRTVLTSEESAKTLGASPKQAFFHVLLPMARGLLFITFFQTFLISWFEYGLTTLLGLGQIQTLTLRVFGYIQQGNPTLAALSSLFLFIPPVILLLIYKPSLFRRRF